MGAAQHRICSDGPLTTCFRLHPDMLNAVRTERLGEILLRFFCDIGFIHGFFFGCASGTVDGMNIKSLVSLESATSSFIRKLQVVSVFFGRQIF